VPEFVRVPLHIYIISPFSSSASTLLKFCVKVPSALKVISPVKQGTSFIKLESAVPSLLKSMGAPRLAWVNVQDPSNLFSEDEESSSEEQDANKIAINNTLINRFIIYKVYMLESSK